MRILLVCSLCVLPVRVARTAEAEEADAATKQKTSFAIRPKVGGNLLAKGRIQDVTLDLGGGTSVSGNDFYDVLIQGELGLKGTFHNFGLEFALAGMRGEDKAKSTAPAGTLDGTLKIGGVKLTGTYEFNPQAGLRGFGNEGNVYLGGGLGFYPLTEDVKFTYNDPALGKVKEARDGFGYGVHLVVGGEYFFVEHVGLFAEVQYTYIDIDRENRPNDNLYGFSALGGISIKF